VADYLVFRLYGPLASWGEIAVGESRHSAVYPSKSALLGLLGAAIGVRREDDDGQQALFQGYRFGVKLVSAGTPLRDYHTVQAPSQQRNVRYRSRRQELADKSRLGTLLSAREYRCDSISVVAAEALPDARWNLEELTEALRYPHFPLCLGRKSCPLALPLMPQRVSSETLYGALEISEQPSLLALLNNNPEQAWPSNADRRILRPSTTRYYWEDGTDSGMTSDMEIMRHDQPLSRRRWQFAPRREWVCLSAEGHE
jgi:CRISPR system Cascade subunit CasD